jgi:hypothetical protein
MVLVSPLSSLVPIIGGLFIGGVRPRLAGYNQIVIIGSEPIETIKRKDQTDYAQANQKR